MEFILIIISLLILLVPGFDESVPPTGDKIFKIEYSDNVQSIKTISDQSLAFWGFDITLKQNSSGILDVKIPKNFPFPASFSNAWNYSGTKPYVMEDGVEISYNTIEEPCYFHYKIPVEDMANLEIAYPLITAGTWQLYSPIQFEESHPCYHKVFDIKRVSSPLKQIKETLDFKQIKCKEGLQLIIKSSNGNPACVKKSSIEKLLSRKWGVLEPLPNVVKLDVVKSKLITIGKNQNLEIPIMLSKSSVSEMRIVSVDLISFQDPITNEIMMPIDRFNENETAFVVNTMPSPDHSNSTERELTFLISTSDTTKKGTYVVRLVLFNGNFNLIDSFKVHVQ